MDPFTPVTGRTRRRDTRGTTLIEIVVCLALLGIVCLGFTDFAAANAATDAELQERAVAERVLSEAVTILSVEDPWGGPETRRYSIAGDGGSAPPGPATLDVTVAGTVLCEGRPSPPDNSLASAPGSCPGGVRALRRWTVEVAYPASFREGGRDTLRTTLDMDRTPGSTGWTVGGMIS
ncbi:MAG TPA: prepilin-type N-terminal cleavage/methylation domain-containing protein [Longimicrobiaceae bacterium]